MTDADPETPRQRILAVAKDLIAAKGAEALTTRAVAAAAGVQAPTLYRLFGDKEGLLEALAESVLASYAERKAHQPRHPDPVEELRRGWDAHVDFALQNPDIFRIFAARPGPPRPALDQAIAVLRAKIHAVAAAGRLRLPEDRALMLFHASATGIILALLRQPSPDMTLSSIAREAALAALSGDATVSETTGPVGAALALGAQLAEMPDLSDGERLLLSELLARIARR